MLRWKRFARSAIEELRKLLRKAAQVPHLSEGVGALEEGVKQPCR